MTFLATIWDVLLLFFWGFIFVAALFAVIAVVSDLVRDRALSGWAKAAWFLFVVLVPVLASVIYLIVRGGGMAERADRQAREARDATESYLREVVGTSPAAEIAKAKQLLDDGAITQAEFESIKAKVLATA